MKNNKNKKAAAVLWCLTAACFCIIFYFSSRSADRSNEQSGFIIQFLYRIFGVNATDFIVRKCAHFLEYTGTALLMSAAMYYTFGKNKIYLPIIFTSLYAVSDEVHQIFVPGRSCELRDWAIDTLGAVLGATIFCLIYFVFNKAKDFKTRRQNK